MTHNSQPSSTQATTIQDGWLTAAKPVASPNFNARPDGISPRLIVIHNISLPPAQFDNDYVQDFFLNQLDHDAHPYFTEIKDMEVSAHLFIKRTGDIIQFVSFDERAWHAGKSCYLGETACNDYSIGIELEGTDELAFTDAQYASLTDSILAIYMHYPATRQHLAGHSDIAPGRKTDPGNGFDWQRLRHTLSNKI